MTSPYRRFLSTVIRWPQRSSFPRTIVVPQAPRPLLRLSAIRQRQQSRYASWATKGSRDCRGCGVLLADDGPAQRRDCQSSCWRSRASCRPSTPAYAPTTGPRCGKHPFRGQRVPTTNAARRLHPSVVRGLIRPESGRPHDRWVSPVLSEVPARCCSMLLAISIVIALRRLSLGLLKPMYVYLREFATCSNHYILSLSPWSPIIFFGSILSLTFPLSLWKPMLGGRRFWARVRPASALVCYPHNPARKRDGRMSQDWLLGSSRVIGRDAFPMAPSSPSGIDKRSAVANGDDARSDPAAAWSRLHHLVCVPMAWLDSRPGLIGAGCVATLETFGESPSATTCVAHRFSPCLKRLGALS